MPYADPEQRREYMRRYHRSRRRPTAADVRRDPETGRYRTPPLLDVIATSFTIGDGCWIWHGYKNQRGYGRVKIGRKFHQAHRVLYELLVGPIPEGLELDHVRARGCTSTSCVRPDHMEPVTQHENVLRSDNVAGVNARKTHCPQGHGYTEDNTTVSSGRRKCRACARDRERARRASSKGEPS